MYALLRSLLKSRQLKLRNSKYLRGCTPPQGRQCESVVSAKAVPETKNTLLLRKISNTSPCTNFHSTIQYKSTPLHAERRVKIKNDLFKISKRLHSRTASWHNRIVLYDSIASRKQTFLKCTFLSTSPIGYTK